MLCHPTYRIKRDGWGTRSCVSRFCGAQGLCDSEAAKFATRIRAQHSMNGRLTALLMQVHRLRAHQSDNLEAAFPSDNVDIEVNCDFYCFVAHDLAG